MSLIADASRAATRVFEEVTSPYSQLWKGTPLQNQIPVRKIVGDPIRQQIKFLENPDGGYHAPDGDLDKPRILDQYTQAEWPWAFAEVPFALTRLQIRVNRNPYRLFDLLQKKKEDAEASLQEEKIEPALFGEDTANPGQPDPDPTHLQGLEHIGDNDTTAGVAAYGSIAVSDAPRWQAVRDFTFQNMSEIFLERKYQEIAWDPREPNLIMTTNALFTKYIEGLLPRKRSDAERSMYVGGLQMGSDQGYFLKFHNARLFKNNKCPAKHVYILTTKGPIDPYTDKERKPYLWIAALEGEWFASREYPEESTSERLAFRSVAYHQLINNNRAFQSVNGNVN